MSIVKYHLSKALVEANLSEKLTYNRSIYPWK